MSSDVISLDFVNSGFLLEMAWKSALISGAALAVAAMLRFRPAGERSAILRTAVAMILGRWMSTTSISKPSNGMTTTTHAVTAQRTHRLSTSTRSSAPTPS